MDAAPAAASRRAKPNRGRPLVPPNYVSLRDLQELRLREKEEQRRREEEEAAARRVREEQRKRQEEEEEAAARRFIEERRRREEEAAARRARDAAAAATAPKAEMRASSSSQNSSSFRYNERARGGQRLVVVADRPPPPPRAAGKIDGATQGCLGKKGQDGGAPNAPLRSGFKAQNVGRGKVSAGPGEPDRPATASSHAGKPEEKRNGEASGCQGKSSGTSSASSELAKVDIASCRGPTRPKHRHQGKKKGFDGRSIETAMTSSIGGEVEASPLPIVNVENKGKSRSGDRITETALASMPGKEAEASPPRGVKPDNKGKKKSPGRRQAGAAPSSDLPDVKKVEASGCEGTSSVVSSAPDEQADANGASYRMRLKLIYKRKGKNGLDGRSAETATTIVAGKAADTSPPEGVSLEIKGIKGLIEQGTETALAREEADASLARGFKPENKGKKESSRGRHTGMTPPSIDCPDGIKPQPCPAAVGSDSQKSSGCQGTILAAKTEGLEGKLTVVEVKAHPHLAAESGSYLKSSSDQGMIQAAESEGSKEKQRVVDMRTTAQLKPWDMRNSGRQRPGGHSRVNVAARQHDMVWVPKAAAVADNAEVGKFP
ncbi:unnamed protein product [Alopecurus aequalis]